MPLVIVNLCLTSLHSFSYLSEMTGKDCTRVFLGVKCFAILLQMTYCLSDLNTQFCCVKLSNSSNFSCWNTTLEENNAQNKSTFDNCTQNMGDKLCFNVTQAVSCQNDSNGSVMKAEKKEIHIGAFVPFLKLDKYGHFTAMKMAVDIINNRSDILNNYTLVLDSEDTIWVSTTFICITWTKFRITFPLNFHFLRHDWRSSSRTKFPSGWLNYHYRFFNDS